jgi:hypothetical protein
LKGLLDLGVAWQDYLTMKTEIPDYWLKTKVAPQFTDLEIAAMEGGHSIEKEKKETYSFIKSLKEPTLGHVSRNGKKRPRN